MQSLLGPYIPGIFAGVHPSWKRIILSPELRPKFNKCLNALENYLRDKGVTEHYVKRDGIDTYIRPGHRNILEAFKYFDVQNLVAVLIGQDPYPKREEAHGLCFSAPANSGNGPPRSLSIIYKCLVKHGVVPNTPSHGCLTSWAQQGILMLNKYLTRSPNIQRNKNGEVWVDGNGDSSKEYMHEFWSEFTDALVKYISDNLLHSSLIHRQKMYTAFILWGSKAKGLSLSINTAKQEKYPDRIIEVLEWGHPSPAYPTNNTDSPDSFQNCPHFTHINKQLKSMGLREINWAPGELPDGMQPQDLLDRFYHLRPVPPALLKNKDMLYDDGTATEENKKICEMLKVLKGIKASAKPPAQPPAPEVKEPTESTEPKEPKELKEVEVKIPEPETGPIVMGVDGNCHGNGKVDAVAGYSVFLPARFAGKPCGLGNARDICIRGPVTQHCLVMENGQLKIGTGTTKPTNGRGELLGLINGLQYVLAKAKQPNYVKKPILIIMDATYTMHLANERLWKYLLKDPALAKVTTNKDLVLIVKELLCELVNYLPSGEGRSTGKLNFQQIWDILIQPNAHDNSDDKKPKKPMDLRWNGLTLVHQDSHLPKDKIPKPTDLLAYDTWLCNHKADKLCDEVILAIEKNDARWVGGSEESRIVPRITED